MVNVNAINVGDDVDLLYPVHGSRNILRRVLGVCIDKAIGPGGPYIKVESNGDVFRNLSSRKIVQMQR